MDARILIVEDEEVARNALAELLRDEGYLVETADGGGPALAMVAEDPPDLVISDVRMPRGDGLDLVRNLRARPATARIPVMLVSACAEADRRITGLDLGADDFVSKPVDLDELLARIRARIRRVEERDDLERRATTDRLTGLPTRDALTEVLEREERRARRTARPLSLMMLDIDAFGAINQAHGHRVGDLVLRRVARALDAAIHDEDHLGRWGGDEFLVILPDCPADLAAQLTARLRHHDLPQLAIDDRVSVPIHVSVGTATFVADDTVETLLARVEADLRLHQLGDPVETASAAMS